jgi:hypothetical protein
MSRHPAMAAAPHNEPDPRTSETPHAPAETGARLVLPTFGPDIDPERYDRLKPVDACVA